MTFKQSTDLHYRNLQKVKLADTKPVVINGSFTGRTYIFRSEGELNWVDKRDLNDFRNNVNFVII